MKHHSLEDVDSWLKKALHAGNLLVKRQAHMWSQNEVSCPLSQVDKFPMWYLLWHSIHAWISGHHRFLLVHWRLSPSAHTTWTHELDWVDSCAIASTRCAWFIHDELTRHAPDPLSSSPSIMRQSREPLAQYGSWCSFRFFIVAIPMSYMLYALMTTSSNPKLYISKSDEFWKPEIWNSDNGLRWCFMHSRVQASASLPRLTSGVSCRSTSCP